MSRVAAFVVACGLCVTSIHAADQAVLGKRLLVKDPKPGLTARTSSLAIRRWPVPP